jgi:hypothetical protein
MEQLLLDMLHSNAKQQTTLDDILDTLVQGCDERVHINAETRRNKYHLNPVHHQGLFQRGSCTANVLTPRAEQVSRTFLEKYTNLNYDSLLENQSHRLKELVQSEFRDPFDVFFAPSGSDLVYYPIMFQRLLNPNSRLVNIVSCSQELGSGSIYASESKFYGLCNQFGEATQKGDLVDPLQEVEVHCLSARSKNGIILDRTQAFQDIIEQNTDAAIVGSLVLGSKSGIKDDLKVIDPESDTMWVVDLCQFRVDHSLIHKLLELGVLVMLTGSKFFQAPPFCAAMLVPRSWCERLRAVEDVSSVGPFSRLFSAYDLPWYMENLRNELPHRENKGLRLRWEIALDEMEAYSAWSFEQTESIINMWSQKVMTRLASSPYFKLMPDQLKTNSSIISFQVWINDSALNHTQLKQFYKSVCTVKHQEFSDDIDRVFFGQPVAYGDKSFIRLALGSHSIRGFLEEGQVDLADDFRLIEVLEDYVERLFGS